jgi:hypothetical protein
MYYIIEKKFGMLIISGNSKILEKAEDLIIRIVELKLRQKPVESVEGHVGRSVVTQDEHLVLQRNEVDVLVI